MTVDTAELKQYDGKKVVVTRNLESPNEKGESAVEVEGVVQAGNELGILIKPKGQVQFKLIPAAEIEEIRLADDKPQKLKASKLNIVKLGQARKHLLERHGYTLDWVNGVNEEQAFEHHKELDHEGLGHVHVDKEAEKAEKAADESDDTDSAA